jgi:hypothetical protein
MCGTRVQMIKKETESRSVLINVTRLKNDINILTAEC